MRRFLWLLLFLFALVPHAKAQSTCTPGDGVSCTPNMDLWLLPRHYLDWDIPWNQNASVIDAFYANTINKTPTAPQEICCFGLTVDGFLTAQSVNGILYANRFPGADLGAQIASAFSFCSDAAPCHVYIPPGVYTYSTPVLLPRRSRGLELTCDRNATLTYTGVGDAFSTQPAVSSTNDAGTMLDGGCALLGTSAATSGVHFRPGQGYSLVGWQISGFSQGDGIWVDGANVVWLTRNSSRGNLNGLHITGNRCNVANICNWDRPNSPTVWVASGISDIGFAPNAVKAVMNRFTQNSHWGILEGDVVGGSNTQAFNNSFENNDLEGNGMAGAPYGAALSGFTRDSSYVGNYLEGNPAGIVLGCVAGTPAGVVPQTGYTVQFCGNADKSVVKRNFLNDLSTASEVLLNFANSPSVDDNGVNSNAHCLVDNNASAGNISIHGNIVYGSGSYTCQNGSPGGTLVNFRMDGDASIPGQHFYGTTQVDGAFTTGTLARINTGNTTQTGADVIVAIIGSLVIHQSTVTPGGACGTPNTTNIWFAPAGMYICNGNDVWKPISTP